MLRNAISALLVAVIFTSASAFADNLVVDGIQPDGSAERPSRGLSQQSVETRWGQPNSKSSPVGEPPISSWEYGTFVVYFEYDKVIHSVVKRQGS